MAHNNSLSDIRVIGFDLDQTLYPKSSVIDEKIQGYLYQKIAEHKGVSLTEAKRLFTERYRAGAGLSGRQTLEDLGLPNASELVQEALEHSAIAPALIPNKETNQLLSDLRTKYEGIDLITGSDLQQTVLKLTALDLSNSFLHIITANDSMKSTGDSYRSWLAFYPHLLPQQFLYVGDRIRIDHEVPSALGIRTALVYVRELDPVSSAIQLSDFFGLRTLLLE